MRHLRWLAEKLKRNVHYLLCLAILGIFSLQYFSSKVKKNPLESSKSPPNSIRENPDDKPLSDSYNSGHDETFTLTHKEVKNENLMKESHQRILVNATKKPSVISKGTVNPNVHVFYYAWYGSPGLNGEYFASTKNI